MRSYFSVTSLSLHIAVLSPPFPPPAICASRHDTHPLLLGHLTPVFYLPFALSPPLPSLPFPLSPSLSPSPLPLSPSLSPSPLPLSPSLSPSLVPLSPSLSPSPPPLSPLPFLPPPSLSPLPSLLLPPAAVLRGEGEWEGEVGRLSAVVAAMSVESPFFLAFFFPISPPFPSITPPLTIAHLSLRPYACPLIPPPHLLIPPPHLLIPSSLLESPLISTSSSHLPFMPPTTSPCLPIPPFCILSRTFPPSLHSLPILPSPYSPPLPPHPCPSLHALPFSSGHPGACPFPLHRKHSFPHAISPSLTLSFLHGRVTCMNALLFLPPILYISSSCLTSHSPLTLSSLSPFLPP
ncbi:unnamed protein product [Closterium sp. Naga37s-1]|nr:unnamed protein product [Closterium sp. Naga37s-1]